MRRRHSCRKEREVIARISEEVEVRNANFCVSENPTPKNLTPVRIVEFKFQKLKKEDYVMENSDYINNLINATANSALYAYSEKSKKNNLFFEATSENLEELPPPPIWVDGVNSKISNYFSGYSEAIHDEYTMKNIAYIGTLSDAYEQHISYWVSAPLPTHLVRYEDLLSPNALTTTMDVLAFLLPSQELPEFGKLLCALESDDSAQPYHSPKRPTFASWDYFDDDIRNWLITKLVKLWCKYGYNQMATDAGLKTNVNCRAL